MSNKNYINKDDIPVDHILKKIKNIITGKINVVHDKNLEQVNYFENNEENDYFPVQDVIVLREEKEVTQKKDINKNNSFSKHDSKSFVVDQTYDNNFFVNLNDNPNLEEEKINKKFEENETVRFEGREELRFEEVKSKSSDNIAKSKVENDYDYSLDNWLISIIRPQIKEWLDQNLPQMVKKIVEQEIKNLTKRGNK